MDELTNPKQVNDYKGDFFRVLLETPLSQIVTMTIEPEGDSGPPELHEGDQIVYVIEGEAVVEIGEETFNMVPGMVATIPACTAHHVYNKGEKDLFFLTIYTPPAY